MPRRRENPRLPTSGRCGSIDFRCRVPALRARTCLRTNRASARRPDEPVPGRRWHLRRSSREECMTTTIERDGPVTTLVRERIEARNAMDPASAEGLVEALLAFDRDPGQSVAVLWGAGGA